MIITTTQHEILSSKALEFLKELHNLFSHKIAGLLKDREKPFTFSFNNSTKHIRSSEWQVVYPPGDLVDRRVEITGPLNRKMVINAHNSGANVFMADFEDSTSPVWKNILNGQVNLRDAVNKTITFYDSKKCKKYSLNEETATLMVRPRGFHLLEEHVSINGEPIRASLFDFGLYFFHNAKNLLANGTGPYFYLPKLESYLEARVWNQIFKFSETYLNIAPQSIRATVLIETLPAAFQMDEILWELRRYSAGLNCGRWDYIFSFIKKFKDNPDKILPDRDQVTMDKSFLNAYSQLLIKTCHKRGAHAMGGMAAQIPIKNSASANEAAIKKVYLDKLREVTNGHDGTWVAHPGLVPIAKEVFDSKMPTKNQIHIPKEDVNITEEDLIAVPEGTITIGGIRKNINIGILYIEAWLSGSGCIPLYNLMEDAATAEISRTQIWQWLKHQVKLLSGESFTKELFITIFNEELKFLIDTTYKDGCNLIIAADLFRTLCLNEDLEEFLTLTAYAAIK